MASPISLEGVLRELARDPHLAAKADEALAVLPAINALRHAFEQGRSDGLFRSRTAPLPETELGTEWAELVARTYRLTYNEVFDLEL